MTDKHRRIALVTGASSGIGLEFARLLAADRYDLVLVARNAQRLERLAQGFRAQHDISAHVFAGDLSEPGAAAAAWSHLVDRGVAVDILVNNAGIGLYGPLAEQDDDAVERMLTLNVSALTTFTRFSTWRRSPRTSRVDHAWPRTTPRSRTCCLSRRVWRGSSAEPA
jgi:short-subunit dehydrogenase